MGQDVAKHEGVLYNFRWTGKVIEYEGKIQFVKANIKSFPIAVIEGEIFEIGMKNTIKERAEAN